MKKSINMSENNKRYKVDKFHSKSLEGNPLNSPADRDINIYLPPGYFERKNDERAHRKCRKTQTAAQTHDFAAA